AHSGHHEKYIGERIGAAAALLRRLHAVASPRKLRQARTYAHTSKAVTAGQFSPDRQHDRDVDFMRPAGIYCAAGVPVAGRAGAAFTDPVEIPAALGGAFCAALFTIGAAALPSDVWPGGSGPFQHTVAAALQVCSSKT